MSQRDHATLHGSMAENLAKFVLVFMTLYNDTL